MHVAHISQYMHGKARLKQEARFAVPIHSPTRPFIYSPSHSLAQCKAGALLVHLQESQANTELESLTNIDRTHCTPLSIRNVGSRLSIPQFPDQNHDLDRQLLRVDFSGAPSG